VAKELVMARLDYNFQHEASLGSGDIADLSLVSYLTPVGKEYAVVKQVRSPDDEDLLITEADMLRVLADSLPKDTWKNCVPRVLEQDPGRNVLEYFPGWLTAETLRSLEPEIDGKTLVWMWKRLLGLIGWVHHLGYVHGAILPKHVLYFPDGPRLKNSPRQHAIRVIDWCYATKFSTRDRLKAWCPDFADFYPVEIQAKRQLGPWTDIYMSAKLMQYLAGGDVKTRQIPSHIPLELGLCLMECMEYDLTRRPQKASDVFTEVVEIASEVYGEPKYHQFEVRGL
jgi:hypothetical protein